MNHLLKLAAYYNDTAAKRIALTTLFGAGLGGTIGYCLPHLPERRRFAAAADMATYLAGCGLLAGLGTEGYKSLKNE